MEPIQYTIASIAHLLHLTMKFPSRLGWVFRGQGNAEWPLLPKAGRPDYFSAPTDYWAQKGQSSNDLGRFKMWRDQAVAFCDSLPENDLDCLAFAQHYGLATRLLDWSSNPLTALFFAVESELGVDGAVFAYFPWWVVRREEFDLEERYERFPLVRPRPIDRRIISQGGVFTLHSNPQQPVEAGELQPEMRAMVPEGVNLAIFRVSHDIKPMIQSLLEDLGISRKTLFPDLEGLSSSVNWSTARSVKASAGKPSGTSPSV